MSLNRINGFARSTRVVTSASSAAAKITNHKDDVVIANAVTGGGITLTLWGSLSGETPVDGDMLVIKNGDGTINSGAGRSLVVNVNGSSGTDTIDGVTSKSYGTAFVCCQFVYSSAQGGWIETSNST